MSESFDFDKYWVGKLAKGISEVVGDKIVNDVLEGSENISQKSSRDDVFEWSDKAIRKLESLTKDEETKKILLSCACHQSQEALQQYRDLYVDTENIDQVIQKMQEDFEVFIIDELKLEDKYIQEIIDRKMGFAGIIEGNKIIATKIPKSSFIKEWFEETDPTKKRALFCHCPRIRDALIDKEKILPKSYCYCGGGYYQNIWETILQKPVDIEILETVMHGDEVCKFAIHLPED
ncbi:MAG: hypothetical protein KAS52_01865 [Candidatus Heimdallarchaeota archaeon]|nr:hypothetical protein [Candidatus Heimdallarchaeota archaeon]